jgi:hypothetical protein
MFVFVDLQQARRVETAEIYWPQALTNDGNKSGPHDIAHIIMQGVPTHRGLELRGIQNPVVGSPIISPGRCRLIRDVALFSSQRLGLLSSTPVYVRNSSTISCHDTTSSFQTSSDGCIISRASTQFENDVFS